MVSNRKDADQFTTKLRLSRNLIYSFLDIHTMPQGVMAFLIEGQVKGIKEVTSTVGARTFLDSKTGGGTNEVTKNGKSFVRSNGDTLVYTLLIYR